MRSFFARFRGKDRPSVAREGGQEGEEQQKNTVGLGGKGSAATAAPASPASPTAPAGAASQPAATSSASGAAPGLAVEPSSGASDANRKEKVVRRKRAASAQPPAVSKAANDVMHALSKLAGVLLDHSGFTRQHQRELVAAFERRSVVANAAAELPRAHTALMQTEAAVLPQCQASLKAHMATINECVSTMLACLEESRAGSEEEQHVLEAAQQDYRQRYGAERRRVMEELAKSKEQIQAEHEQKLEHLLAKFRERQAALDSRAGGRHDEPAISGLGAQSSNGQTGLGSLPRIPTYAETEVMGPSIDE